MTTKSASKAAAEGGIITVSVDRERWNAIARAQSELIDILARRVLASIERSEAGVDGRSPEDRKDGPEHHAAT